MQNTTNHHMGCFGAVWANFSLGLRRQVLVVVIVLGVFDVSAAKAQSENNGDVFDVVHLVAGNWPPFVSSELPGYGFSSMIVRNALRSQGQKLEVQFYPWRRTLGIFQSSPEIVGYFPEYRTEELEEKYLFSDPVGESPVGFVSMIETGFDWNDLSDLKKYHIGVVDGYSNEPEFDALVRSGKLDVTHVNNDVTLLRLLRAGRVDVIVIDQNVMRNLVEKTPDLVAEKNRFHFSPKRLVTRKLHVALRRNSEGRRIVDVLNKGLRLYSSPQENNQNEPQKINPVPLHSSSIDASINAQGIYVGERQQTFPPT